MISTYTAKYDRTESGNMDQQAELPEVVTEGKILVVIIHKV